MPPIRRNRNNAVERVCDRFGGFSPFARLMNLHRNTPSHWSERGGNIPSQYHKKILALAKRHKIRLRPADLVNV